MYDKITAQSSFLGVLTVDGSSRQLQFDVLSGDFLIDGSPAARLPKNIMEHNDFTRLFRVSTFVVRPVGEARGGFVSIHKHHGAHYMFALRPVNDKILESNSEAESESKSFLLVTEKHEESGEEFLLISFWALAKLVPYALARDYSHWFNISKNTIDFRSKRFNASDFTSNITYQLNLSSGHLLNVKRGGQLVNINSSSFYQTQNIFNRIEQPELIHVVYHIENDSSRVIVDLLRFNLQFEITRERSVRSLQYSNMCVSLNQKRFRVLIGLMKGLLLEPTEDFAGLMSCALLIPHVHAKIIEFSIFNDFPFKFKSRDGHQRVDINLWWKLVEQSPYFKYDVDTRLRQLRAPPREDAAAYLALLHAVTASPLPEPFTGLTGTEMALLILQTARCWSNEKRIKYYSDEPSYLRVLETIVMDIDYLQPFLHKILNGLSSLCANIALKLVSDIDMIKRRNSSSGLQRMYYRSKILYSPQAQIDMDFEPLLNIIPASAVATGWRTDIEQHALRVIAELCSKWRAGRSAKCRT